MGDMDLAKKLIDTAAKVCSAHVAKFQKRHNIELLTPQEYNAPHPVPANSYGETYGAHREFLEFNVEQHKELQEECKLTGIENSRRSAERRVGTECGSTWRSGSG